MLLLASASPARRRLLEQAAIPHRVRVSGVDEDAIQESDPTLLVQRLAQIKAGVVADLERQEAADVGPGVPGSAASMPVLGCDSLLVFGGEVFGKPLDPDEAMARWRRMAGAWGELHTGHCLISPQADLVPRLATVTTRVQFAPLTPAQIEAYVATGEPLHCAGGFALEGIGGLTVERIEGCFSNVIGLSLPLLRRWLQPLG